MNNNELDLTQGKIMKTLLKLAFPIMLSNFLMMFYNLTDAFWLGKLGAEAKNAVSVAGLTFPLVFFISSFGFGFVVAGTSLVSQYKGAQKYEKAREVVGQFVFILVLFCLIFITLSFLFIDKILIFLNTPTEIIESARSYISVILSGMVFMFIFLTYQSFSHGLGDTVSPMKIQFFSVGLNVILDPIMIFGLGFLPKMGIQGAAYATVISRFLAAVLAFSFFFKKLPHILPRFKNLLPNPQMIRRILQISVPSSLAQSITSFGFLILQSFVNSYGTVVISTFSIGNRMTGIFMMPAMGISNALAAVIGQNLGAKQINRAEKSVAVAMRLVLAIMFLGCTFVFLFGSQLTRFFIDEPQVIELGHRMFRITAVATLFFSVGFIFMGVFNGSGHTKSAMVFNVSRLWLFRIPFVFLLSGKLIDLTIFQNKIWQNLLNLLASPLASYPYDALWWSMIFSNFLAGIWAFVLYRKGGWKAGRIHN